MRDAIDERAKFERDNLNAHAELLQIVLDKRGHFGAVGVGRTGEDRKLDGLAHRVEESGVAVR